MLFELIIYMTLLGALYKCNASRQQSVPPATTIKCALVPATVSLPSIDKSLITHLLTLSIKKTLSSSLKLTGFITVAGPKPRIKISLLLIPSFNVEILSEKLNSPSLNKILPPAGGNDLMAVKTSFSSFIPSQTKSATALIEGSALCAAISKVAPELSLKTCLRDP